MGVLGLSVALEQCNSVKLSVMVYMFYTYAVPHGFCHLPHMWLMRIWNVVAVTEELFLILI